MTGCQWQALDKTNLCKHSVAHKRFQEWRDAGVFEEFWRRGLLMYDEKKRD
jgi:transposase